jgi:predicted deacylase
MNESTVLTVAAGADHAAIDLPLLRSVGATHGPHVVILGGVHGDEYEGIAAAACVWHDLDAQALRGTVSIVPTANLPACGAGTRTSPIDGLNLARTFPGDVNGSVTERIAHSLSELIRTADLLIDLHSAGQHYAMPLLCGSYVADDELGRRCQAAALAFGAPIYWAHPDISPGRSLSVALDAGIPSIYVECGGGGRVRSTDLAAYRQGVLRVLAQCGALPDVLPAAPPGMRLRSSGDVDLALAVTHRGILLEGVALLQGVRRGDVLGQVIDERGQVLETLHAPADGIVVMARRTARVCPGDGAYLLAQPDPDEGLSS